MTTSRLLDHRDPAHDLLAAPRRILPADDLAADMLRDLPRKDQRRVGNAYVEALMQTEGRKTARGMSRAETSTADEQRFNHFISGSTWSWEHVTDRLRASVRDFLRPSVWVLDELHIPKTGLQSVGVHRSFRRETGRSVPTQRAFGVWGVGGGTAAPVGWRLHMPPEWSASLPAHARLDLARWGAEARPCRTAAASIHDSLPSMDAHTPLVADVRDLDVARVLLPLLTSGQGFVVRIDGRTRLQVVDDLLYTWTGSVMAAAELVEASSGLRHPCRHVGLRAEGIDAVRAVTVRLPGEAALVRLVVGESGARGERSSLWLTNLTGPAEEALVLRQALALVRSQRETRTAQLGLRDFSGRSYDGWHRHMALVAVAHRILQLRCGRPTGLVAPVGRPGLLSV